MIPFDPTLGRFYKQFNSSPTDDPVFSADSFDKCVEWITPVVHIRIHVDDTQIGTFNRGRSFSIACDWLKEGDYEDLIEQYDDSVFYNISIEAAEFAETMYEFIKRFPFPFIDFTAYETSTRSAKP